MKAAADKADGPVCIATEGLTVYLNSDEKHMLMENIRRILSEKGGCWLNADVETLEYYMAVFRAVDSEHAGDLWAATGKIFAGQSDTNMRQNASDIFSGERKGNGKSLKVDYEKIEAMYKKSGLLVEKVPYYRDDFELHIFDDMSRDEISNLMENIRHVNVWKITPNPDFSQKSDDILEKYGEDSNLQFEVKSELTDGVFSVSIHGRLDSITAPELLRQFRQAGDGIEAIRMDAGGIEYISSAGIRVLHMMHDSLENKDNFEITGCRIDLGFK
jgi:anti-anti-sigma factor